ncbi:helix-turn-helix domain-containing protein [Xylophilus sp. Kf1]|nr:helix-turn-helix domain-containing protein [Xylophilus sp. Kf1]
MNHVPELFGATPALDLSPLYRHCVFRSDAAVESHDQVSRELSDHDLVWRGGRVDTAMHKASLRQTSMFTLRYGAEVEVRPRPFDDFVLVHMSLRGAAEIESDGRRIHIPEGRTALIAPRKDIRMWWQQGSEQFILKVPHSLLGRRGQVPVLPAAALMPTHCEAHWRLMMQSMVLTTALQNGSPAHAAWVDHFEQNVALFLRTQHGFDAAPPALEGAGCTDALASAGDVAGGTPEGHEAGTGSRRVEAMERYMVQRLAAPIALADLARAAGVGVRTLGVLCQRHRGTSPMDLLRGMRLDAARARLLAGAGNVTETALEFGFGHLGRFSAYYRDRFGELPRETGAVRH